jgi:hypothetical protein
VSEQKTAQLANDLNDRLGPLRIAKYAVGTFEISVIEEKTAVVMVMQLQAPG